MNFMVQHIFSGLEEAVFFTSISDCFFFELGSILDILSTNLSEGFVESADSCYFF